MEPTALPGNDGLWQAPEWYRALCLAERLALSEPRTFVPSALDAHAERAMARLRTWKAQKPFEQESVFAERLALDSLSEHDLFSLLAETAQGLKARIPAVPDWLVALRDVDSGRGSPEELLGLLEGINGDHPLAACLPALSPFFRRALTSLDSGVEALQQRYAFLPFNAGALPAALLTNIVPNILFQVSKPVILEMHIARLEGRLQGETSEARFEHFMRQIREEGLFSSLLVKYPVLARQLLISIDQWVDYLHEFLTHLCGDWETIRSTLAADGDPGPLVEVDAGKGDRHRKGRSVLLLRFASGMRLLYKPKPLAVDVHFQELLSWLNDRGADPGLRLLKLLDRGDYGWSEFVATSPCTSREEVGRFYERLGSHLALLYALDAVDLHNENLIASGEHPVLVDLEALLHPHIGGDGGEVAANLAVGALDRSVWQVGILPRRVWSDDDSVGVDVSGVGGQPGQINPHPVLGWDGAGSDEMRLGRRRVELPVSENQPRLIDQAVEALDYKHAVIAGFTRMYRLLCQHREALLTEQLPRFARDEIRVVVRSTNVYGLLLYESFHPDLLRDALDRDRFFDRLWGEVAQHRHLARVLPAERRDLWQGDIPVFRTFPESRTLFTSDGQPLVDFLNRSSLDVVRQRVEQLGEGDLAKQTWIIEASFATLHMGREDAAMKPLSLSPPGRSVGRGELLAIAESLGKRLDELALQNHGGAYWLGVGPLNETTWGLFPSGTDLYAGSTGIALFLAYLGGVTGNASHTRLAHRALASLRPQLRSRLKTGGEEQGESLGTVGGFDGLASVIYLLTNLGVLWAEPSLLDEAEELVERLPPLISRDKNLDVIYGSAGCVLSLLSLHAVRPSARTLEVAIQCGDRLLATAKPMPQGIAWTTLRDQPPLGGFSHGTAGIALSLQQLAARSGRARFREAALRALAYDRSLFVPELNNWADLRVFPSRQPDSHQPDRPTAEPTWKSMVAWCHGAPGIGLGRLAALPWLDDETTRYEIDVALRTTSEQPLGNNHSLCHGALGNIELLLMACRVLGRPSDQEALDRATALAVRSIDANGYLTGVPLGVETPGLMTGLAGMGYELLRLAEPDKVPSTLLLAPPCWQTLS